MSEKEQDRALEVQFASQYPLVLELGAYTGGFTVAQKRMRLSSLAVWL